MDYLRRALKNIVRFARVTAAANNSDQFPVQQVSYKGVISDTLCLFQYGSYANLPNDALGVMFSIDGDDSNTAMIAYTPKQRPTDLAQGEVAHYHPVNNSKIVFRNNGDIEVVCTNDNSVSITGGQSVSIDGDQSVAVGGNCSVTVSGSCSINVSGDADIKANSVNVDASVTNLGVGGPNIARLGDSVEVNVTSGSSSGTWSGTITSAGTNTSI